MSIFVALALYYLIIFIIAANIFGFEIALYLILGSTILVVVMGLLLHLVGVSTALGNSKETENEMRISHSLGEPYYTYNLYGDPSTIEGEQEEL